jgi:hypothetical protein
MGHTTLGNFSNILIVSFGHHQCTSCSSTVLYDDSDAVDNYYYDDDLEL